MDFSTLVDLYADITVYSWSILYILPSKFLFPFPTPLKSYDVWRLIVLHAPKLLVAILSTSYHMLRPRAVFATQVFDATLRSHL